MAKGIVLCLLLFCGAMAQGNLRNRRGVGAAAASKPQCAVTDRLLDMLQRYMTRYDELMDKYNKLVETLSNLQTNQGVSGKDCAELYRSGVKHSGVYPITPSNGDTPFEVYCDMETDKGGWTMIQRRFDGSVDFYRGWQDYKQGFGNMNGEHWLGNDLIHLLTSQDQYELRIDLRNAAGCHIYAHYSSFSVGSERDKYRLSIGTYSGNAVDSLIYHNGMPFSTKDRDNDNYRESCAVNYLGAWWHNKCHNSNLNGLYQSTTHAGIVWDGERNKLRIFKTTEMKIRPRGFKAIS